MLYARISSTKIIVFSSLNARYARTSTPDQFRDMIKRNARNNSKLEFENSQNLSTISKLSEEQQKDNTGLFLRDSFLTEMI